MSVRFIVAPVLSLEFARLFAAQGWTRVFWRPGDFFAAYESPRVLPRAYVVGDVIGAADDASLGVLQRPGFDPWRSVVIERAADARRIGAITPATVSTYEPTRVVVSATADAPGWLVLTDTYYPGWNARVDGEPVPIERANSIFRAVRIAPGTHEVTFSYEPASFWWGSVVSVLALLVLCGIASTRDTTRPAVHQRHARL